MQKQRHIQDEDTFFISQENNLIHFLRTKNTECTNPHPFCYIRKSYSTKNLLCLNVTGSYGLLFFGWKYNRVASALASYLSDVSSFLSRHQSNLHIPSTDL